ncbi:MAG: di-heme enzyme [Nannocystaceae bacterium]|nr:di-heme enzyme [Nannocystaceae bacterium]
MKRILLLSAALPVLACTPVGVEANTSDDSTGSEGSSWDTIDSTNASSSGDSTSGSNGETSTEPDTSTGSGSDDESGSSGTGGQESEWEWDLPEHFPEPKIPQNNPMTAEKVELGRHLFYDEQLSANGTQACASCHRQELAFTDGLALPVGSTGDIIPRNSMSLANVAYSSRHTWGNPVLESLSQQATIPLFNEIPTELGAVFAEQEILDRLADTPLYLELFESAYPDDSDRIRWINIRDAIASFQRSLISFSSPYDAFITGDDDAISASAKRGANLFFGELFECHHCHNGFNFTNATEHAGTVFDTPAYFNTGLYNIDGEGTYPEAGWGIAEFTLEADDMGKHKPPTLRNIALTGPYMHDGSIATLDEVVETYAAGGRLIEEGPFAGDGRANPYKSSFVSGFEMSEQDKADLLAFLESLTDEVFISDPKFSDPWK